MNSSVLIFIFACTVLQIHSSQDAGKNLGESLKNLSPEGKRQLAEKIREALIKAARPRQEEEDEDESTNLLPEILKVVGSALSLNASALVDSTTNLLPPTVQNYLSGTLSLIANVINPPTTKSPVRSTAAKITEAPPAEKITNAAETTVSSIKTTNEDEDSEEESTPIDLRSNSSTYVTTPAAKLQSITTSVPTATTPRANQSQGNDLIQQVVSKADSGTQVLKNNEAQQNPIKLSPSETNGLDNKASVVSLISNYQRITSNDTSIVAAVPSEAKQLENASLSNSIGKDENNSNSFADLMKTQNGEITFGQKLYNLLSMKKPDIIKYSPEIEGIIELMKFIMENSEILKASVTTAAESSTTSLPKPTALVGLFPDVSNLNYANKFRYGQSSTTNIAPITVTVSTTTVKAFGAKTPTLVETTTDASPEIETTTSDDDEDEDEDENSKAV